MFPSLVPYVHENPLRFIVTEIDGTGVELRSRRSSSGMMGRTVGPMMSSSGVGDMSAMSFETIYTPTIREINTLRIEITRRRLGLRRDGRARALEPCDSRPTSLSSRHWRHSVGPD